MVTLYTVKKKNFFKQLFTYEYLSLWCGGLTVSLHYTVSQVWWVCRLLPAAGGHRLTHTGTRIFLLALSSYIGDPGVIIDQKPTTLGPAMR
jgi:hypothetical protein